VTFVVDNRTRSRVRRKQLRWFRTASLRQKWKRIWKPKRMWLSRRLAHPLPHHRLHLSEWTRFACNKCWATWWHLFWSAEILQNDVRLKRHDDLDCHDDLDSERKERLLWLWNIEKQKTKKTNKTNCLRCWRRTMAQHAKISIAQHCLTQHSLSRCDRFLPMSSLKMWKFHLNSRRVPY
jgi:ribosomal protein S27AE